MTKVKVRLQARRHIYIHNDLANAAYYFKARIEQRIANDDREGVGLEIMAGLTMLAFAIEAKLNFLGDRLVKGWRERAPALVKVETICAHVGITPDFTTRPYLSVKELKEFRDTLAHGKPLDLYFDEEVVATPDELDQRGLMHPDWETFVNKDFLARAYDDVNDIWEDLLARSKLEVFETLTRGDRSMQFIDHVE
ncbi:hypothetical protein GCM10010869_09640 [Mesorhizobium tianshanense]|uniref:HEPN domain-containing protein n=1 Tax=Mesorhizobium tianshanense TaxID=39844 RepID=A0A562NLH2_9HYPH|nr:hypothetical protein [Mesorhizobium tianshanense]TWI33034.1 hypothetical protein IQ26_04243 [Mesorhizobium tianshanense]GLS35376.1 hypothetical protein GCM10010869_09640 [Mesorhizobium tianshanense]